MDEEKEERKKKGFFVLFFERVNLRRLFILFLALIITGGFLGTSTYAWFTSNFTVSVQQIDVSVSSGSGIQISTNGTDWKSIITTEDILTKKYDGAVNQIPTETDLMNPVSTVMTAYPNATEKTQGLKMFKGTIVSDVNNGVMYLNSTQETDGVTEDYVAFDLFIKLDSANDRMLYLTNGTNVKAGEPNTSIEYASRIGFVVNGHTTSSDSLNNIINLKGATNVFIAEPNYDVHTGNGLANGRDVYNITGFTENGNATKVPYNGIKGTFAYDGNNSSTGVPLASDPTTHSSYFEAVDTNIIIPKANTEKIEFMTISPGITKMRVYMWVEGQDIDCENTASGGQIVFTLGFTVDE